MCRCLEILSGEYGSIWCRGQLEVVEESEGGVVVNASAMGRS